MSNKRILKRNWRINRAYKKMRRSHPELTKSDFIQNLRTSITLGRNLKELKTKHSKTITKPKLQVVKVKHT